MYFSNNVIIFSAKLGLFLVLLSSLFFYTEDSNVVTKIRIFIKNKSKGFKKKIII